MFPNTGPNSTPLPAARAGWDEHRRQNRRHRDIDQRCQRPGTGDRRADRLDVDDASHGYEMNIVSRKAANTASRAICGHRLTPGGLAS